MRKLLVGFVFLTALCVVGRAEQFEGYISDAGCAKKNRSKVYSEEHAECAQKCIDKGDKAVLVTEDGRVLEIANQDQVMAHVGSKVLVMGDLKGNSLTVNDIKPMPDDAS